MKTWKQLPARIRVLCAVRLPVLQWETAAVLGWRCLISANEVMASEFLIVRSADGYQIVSVAAEGRIS